MDLPQVDDVAHIVCVCLCVWLRTDWQVVVSTVSSSLKSGLDVVWRGVVGQGWDWYGE
jgi:hypothetical protein